MMFFLILALWALSGFVGCLWALRARSLVITRQDVLIAVTAGAIAGGFLLLVAFLYHIAVSRWWQQPARFLGRNNGQGD